MCGICGFIANKNKRKDISSVICNNFNNLAKSISERGHDSCGFSILYYDTEAYTPEYKIKLFKYNDVQKALKENSLYWDLFKFARNKKESEAILSIICNFRAEPTVERVKIIDDYTIQPFYVKGYGSVAHNGTVANDKDILKEYNSFYNSFWSQELEETHGKLVDTYSLLPILKKVCDNKFSNEPFDKIEGGFALAYQNENGNTILARNFRGLAFQRDCDNNLWFASDKQNLSVISSVYGVAYDMEPYSYKVFAPNATYGSSFNEVNKSGKAVVICSGGLDSTTVATIACQENKEVTLLHFLYGCKAEPREKEAIINITNAINKKLYPGQNKINYKFIDLSWLKDLGGSVLTDPNRFNEIAEGDAGVETLNAWVPARNLVMMSLAASYCDRYKVDSIYLGANMEEGSVFPDNTTSFSKSFEYCMNFGTLQRPEVKAPLRFLMKKDIIKKAYEVKSPIHLSWSCYHDVLCDNIDTECGPCRMRRIALEENGLTLKDFEDMYNE